MREYLLIPLDWVLFCIVAAGGSGLVFGAFILAAPHRCIHYYQLLMKCFNWNVSPVNHDDEVRNTRLLGIVLIVLSVLIFVILKVFEWQE